MTLALGYSSGNHRHNSCFECQKEGINRPWELCNFRFCLSKSKFENYKKRIYTAEIIDRIALIVVSAEMAVIKATLFAYQSLNLSNNSISPI